MTVNNLTLSIDTFSPSFFPSFPCILSPMCYKKLIPYRTLSPIIIAPKVEQVLFHLVFFTKFPQLSHPHMLSAVESSLSRSLYLIISIIGFHI